MVDRRSVMKGLGLAVAGLAAGDKVAAQSMAEVANVPPNGPWTTQGEVQRAGGVMHYATLGKPTDAPPVILLHKLGGWIADWRDVAPHLASGRQVIAFDMPGHGASIWQGAPPYLQSVRETAMLVTGALDAMGVAQVDLAGTSLGGCVALAIAALCPERVRKLALVSCVTGPARTIEQVKATDLAQGAYFTPAGDPLPIDPRMSIETFGLLNGERIAAEQNASRRQAGRWIRPQERGVAFTDLESMLPRVQAPTLLLYGDRDKFFLKYRENTEKTLTDVRTIILKNASGFPVQDNPVETAAALTQFLNQ